MSEEPPLLNYKYRFIILLVLLALILLIGICLAQDQKPLKTPVRGFYGHSDMFLEPMSAHYVPYVETYGSLIDCLSFEESSNDPEAINPCDIDGKPKFGLLQFGEATFQEQCVERFGLIDDIFDPRVQRECADKLIESGQLWRWGTRESCQHLY